MPHSADLYRSTPRTVRRYIERVLEAGRVPFVKSSPGLGKSSLAHLVAETFNLFLIDHRLTTSPPEDLSGIPRINAEGYAEYCPFSSLFPIEGTPIPEGYSGWLILLDELPSAERQTIAAAYKLILDRMVGQHKLHAECHIMAAGNLATDRAIVNPMGTAMQSRLIHIEMKESYDEWLLDVAIPQKYDHRLVAFLSQYPSKLMDFDPAHKNATYCCPRTWEFVNDIIYGRDIPTEDVALLAGTITAAIAAEFQVFCAVYKDLPLFKDIVKDPLNTVLPQNNNTSWATISVMMERVDDKNFEALSAYADRFQFQFRVLFYRFAMIRMPTIRELPAFRAAAVSLGNYLRG